MVTATASRGQQTRSGKPVTIVTGAAGGIGRAAVARLAGRGDRVLAVDIDERGLQDTIAAFGAPGTELEAFPADVRDREALQTLCAHAMDQHGRIDYVFDNAALVARGEITELTAENWNTVVETHLTGAFNLCQSVLPHMLQAQQGSILLSASDYAVIGMRAGASYAAAKTGVYSLTKALAAEVAPLGVRINAVGAGPIDTPLLRQGRSADEHAALVARLEAAVPMGRLGTPQEVAAVADFLLSGRAAYITGQLVQPNGGQVMW